MLQPGSDHGNVNDIPVGQVKEMMMGFLELSFLLVLGAIGVGGIVLVAVSALIGIDE